VGRLRRVKRAAAGLGWLFVLLRCRNEMRQRAIVRARVDAPFPLPVDLSGAQDGPPDVSITSAHPQSAILLGASRHNGDHLRAMFPENVTVQRGRGRHMKSLSFLDRFATCSPKGATKRSSPLRGRNVMEFISSTVGCSSSALFRADLGPGVDS
jgi:hypothetical protein